METWLQLSARSLESQPSTANPQRLQACIWVNRIESKSSITRETSKSNLPAFQISAQKLPAPFEMRSSKLSTSRTFPRLQNQLNLNARITPSRSPPIITPMTMPLSLSLTMESVRWSPKARFWRKQRLPTPQKYAFPTSKTTNSLFTTNLAMVCVVAKATALTVQLILKEMFCLTAINKTKSLASRLNSFELMKTQIKCHNLDLLVKRHRHSKRAQLPVQKVLLNLQQLTLRRLRALLN
mmetsp:Transcript_11979/g.25326  ORF Transcript_11979/g.25326 Transcript_11979/m.25326 type:complete len:239 (-) Transcript_11979:112-828(-)